MLQRSVSYQSNHLLLLRITAAMWLLAKWISYKVWIKDRLFPTFPIADFLDALPGSVHLFLLAIAVASLIAVIAFPAKKQWLVTLFCAELLSCLLDQNRWQPWEYQYSSMLFIFIFCDKRQQQITALLIVLLVSTYCFSGLHKLNDGFLEVVWSKMILTNFLKLDTATIHQPSVFYMGYCVGTIETIAGLLLLFQKTRKPAAVVLIGLHLFNLLLLGPAGLNNNKVVWPWNGVMIVWLYCLFQMSHPATVSWKFAFYRWGTLVLIAWGILPALSFFGYWDKYLSSDVYSGKSAFPVVCVADDQYTVALKRYFAKPHTASPCTDGRTIYILKWGLKEMKVVPYPADRTNRQFREKFMRTYPASKASFYLVQEKDTATFLPFP